jgi:hypothetical protein
MENEPTTTFNLKLTLDQINVIMAGIGELPTKVGLPLTEEIRKQVIPQLPGTPAE